MFSAVRNFPRLATLGVFSGSPSTENREKNRSRWTFLCKTKDEDFEAFFSLPDPGYIGTGRMVVASAFVLLRENVKKYGVLTPAEAFGKRFTKRNFFFNFVCFYR